MEREVSVPNTPGKEWRCTNGKFCNKQEEIHSKHSVKQMHFQSKEIMLSNLVSADQSDTSNTV